MKKGTLLKACLGGVLGLMTACTTKAQMPEGKLLEVTYSRRGMMDGFEYYGRAKTMEDSTIVLFAQRKPYGALYRVQLDDEAMQKLRDVIEAEEMYAYKSHYEPPVRVLDGYSWNFYARFVGRRYISSGGSNASPGGEGLKRLKALMVEMVQDEKAEMVPEDEAQRIFYE